MSGSSTLAIFQFASVDGDGVYEANWGMDERGVEVPSWDAGE